MHATVCDCFADAVCRSELREALGDLQDVASLILMRDYFRDQEADL